MAVQPECLVQRPLLLLLGYNVAILILNCPLVPVARFFTVRFWKLHHIAVGAWSPTLGLNEVWLKDQGSACICILPAPNNELG